MHHSLAPSVRSNSTPVSSLQILDAHCIMMAATVVLFINLLLDRTIQDTWLKIIRMMTLIEIYAKLFNCGLLFVNKEYIQKRHGKTGTDRAYYLSQLTKEYNTTTSDEAKQQVLANLANFAYDPVNYDTLWDLNVVDLFLEATNCDVLQQEFGIGGLANICLDPRFREHITSNSQNMDKIKGCLQPTHANNILVNAMTTLMQLVTEDNHTTILTEDLRQRLLDVHRGTTHRHAKTMAAVFLLDYYHIPVEDGHLPSSVNS